MMAQSCRHKETVVSTANIKEKYTSLNYSGNFQGLGCLEGDYQIEVDPDIKPVQHHPRRVPVPHIGELKKKKQDLEKQGIITKVTKSTPWINSLVAVKKPQES